MTDQIAPQPTGYDYSALAPVQAASLQQRVGRVRERLSVAAEAIAAIGRELIAAKEELPHGEFGRWLAAEFGMSDRTARNYMRVAETFKTETVSDLPIAARALYLLSDSDVPEEAREEVIERAQSGEHISAPKAKAAIERHTPQPDTPDATPADEPDTVVELPPPMPEEPAQTGPDDGDDLPDNWRSPPAPGHVKVRVVAGSYEDAIAARDLLNRVLPTKYDQPREASAPKYKGSWRVYSREDVPIAQAQEPVQQQVVDQAQEIERLTAERDEAAAQRDHLVGYWQRELKKAHQEIERLQQVVDQYQPEAEQARKRVASMRSIIRAIAGARHDVDKLLTEHKGGQMRDPARKLKEAIEKIEEEL